MMPADQGPSSCPATAYLALGSNLGDRAAHLHQALELLRNVVGVHETSFLYETPPAYVTDQPPFLNAVCRVTSRLSPQALLTALKQIEREIGRTGSVRFGPREIDLDILFVDNLIVDGEDLTIPHPRLAERSFVLEPLMDLAPDLRDPRTGQSIRELHAVLGAAPLPRVLPLGQRLLRHRGPTAVMGILNLTPDSFSGDGLLAGERAPIDQALTRAATMVAQGATVIDVGGQSTRPGHSIVPEEEEIGRVVPAIRALRRAFDLPISIDTFRSGVARAALDAGATMINDVWGLRYDESLAALAAARHVPLIVMHNRQPFTDLAYAERITVHPAAAADDPVDAVRVELRQRLDFAQTKGVPRWLLVGDPGIGFGKSPAAHMALTRRLNELVDLGYPLLYGPSRKGFIGRLLGGLPPEERDGASAALCALAAERGAALVRVHNVRAALHAVRMADAVTGRIVVE